MKRSASDPPKVCATFATGLVASASDPQGMDFAQIVTENFCPGGYLMQLAPTMDLRQTPVTLSMAAAAAALAAAAWIDPERAEAYASRDGTSLLLWFQVWEGELWRPFTTTLLHGGLFHAVFNVWWLFVFGTTLEQRLGSFTILGIVAILACVTSMAQFVLGQYLGPPAGLVGLSGVVYGLFGMCWAACRYEPGFRVVCPPDIVRVMVVWLLFCIVATRLGMLRVANIAHVLGLVQGYLLGIAIFGWRDLRWKRRGAIAAASVMALLAIVSLWRPPPGPPADYLQTWRESQ